MVLNLQEIALCVIRHVKHVLMVPIMIVLLVKSQMINIIICSKRNAPIVVLLTYGKMKKI